MSATIPPSLLDDLHHLHSQLEELRGQLERGPRQVKAHQANVAKLTADAQAAHDKVKQTRVAADNKQLDLKSSEDRISNWKVQLNECGSNKEYQALTEQIAAAEMAGSVLADEILEMLEKVDSLAELAAEADKVLAAGKQELSRVATEVEQSADRLRSEVTRLEGDLRQAEAQLPGDFKSDYLRVVKAKGSEGIAKAEEGVCSACGQSITLNMRNTLAMGRPEFCKSCGAVLYQGA
ncbi:MAG: hypothetical protein KDA37_07935 [Planctomycetales bacterium]|nr:hypothetical protein [Planctomycetales bacterium]